LLYERAYRSVPEARPLIRRYGVGYAVAVAILLALMVALVAAEGTFVRAEAPASQPNSPPRTG
jgi:hypothetical protein